MAHVPSGGSLVTHCPPAVYKPLIPYAAERNLRLVLVNLRDYPGSPRYTEAELSALGSADPNSQRSALNARGLEIAAFLLWFIKKEKIPRATEGGAGGLGLLAWSWGNTITMSFLAQAAKLPKDSQETLGVYVRSLIFFGTCTSLHGRQCRFSTSCYPFLDSSSHAFGVPHELLEQFMHPLRDPQVPPEKKGSAFERWVSGYYKHAIPPDDTLGSLTFDEVKGLFSDDPISDPPPEHLPTADRLPAKRRAEIVDDHVTTRSHIYYLGVDREVYGEVMHDALWHSTVWPGLRVSVLWCDMSVPDTVLTNAWYVARQLRDNWPQGARKVDVVRFRGANHFVSVCLLNFALLLMTVIYSAPLGYTAAYD